jgi:hypothetical protein
MSTFSSNTTLKVSGAVSAVATASGTMYTCPANSYAIINVLVTSASESDGEVQVDGRTVSLAQIVSAGYSRVAVTAHVGPGQVVSFVKNSGSPTAYISGVQFINTP